MLLLLALLLLGVCIATPPRPPVPYKDLCAEYERKCLSRREISNCRARTEECLLYADNALNVTWSFCNQQNNDNVQLCMNRIWVDFQLIARAIKADSFSY